MNFDQFSEVAAKICPMHVLLDEEGIIVSAGPTLQKLRPDAPMAGRSFFDVFQLNRPRNIGCMEDLKRVSTLKLHLQFRDEPQTGLKGAVALTPGGNVFVDLSFGISVLEAVKDYDLTSADFSHTDLTIELLYLVEAKSAAMEASRQLNLRLQGAKIAAEEQAFTDTLTGLKNRRAMDHILERLITSERPFSIMHVDLDYFKAVNDTLGHAAGDAVLQKVAAVMVAETRKSDTVARVGGDEFVVIFEGLVDRGRLESVARRLIDSLEEPIPYGGHKCEISASIGTTICSRSCTEDAAGLLHQADVALYAAKRAGKACHYFYEPGLEADSIAGAPPEGAADAGQSDAAQPVGISQLGRPAE
jgi:diguanylate cyclase (GGDEF)-like protein